MKREIILHMKMVNFRTFVMLTFLTCRGKISSYHRLNEDKKLRKELKQRKKQGLMNKCFKIRNNCGFKNKSALTCRTLSNGKVCGRFNLCAPQTFSLSVHLLSLRRITIANELYSTLGLEEMLDFQNTSRKRIYPSIFQMLDIQNTSKKRIYPSIFQQC